MLNSEQNDTIQLTKLTKLFVENEQSEILEYGKIIIALANKLLANESLANFKTPILSNKASVLNSIAGLYKNQGNTEEALENYSQSLKLYESIKDRSGISILYNNIGIIYSEQKDLPKALENFEKSFKIQEEIGNKQAIAYFLINIGFIYSQLGNQAKALDNYSRSLVLLKELNDDRGMAMLLNNTGLIYLKQNKPELALDYFTQSLKIRKVIKDEFGIPSSLNSIGSAYYHLKQYKQALLYSDSALHIAKRVAFPVVIVYAEYTISKIDSAMGNYKEAFEHYKQYIFYKDSLGNEKTRKASIKNQLKYDFEKKEAVMTEQQEKERAIAEEKSRFQQIIIGAVILGLLLVIGFAFFIFRTLKTTRHQKAIIEEKQREILDSIHYAKRIQTALITPEKYIDKNLERLTKKD